MQNNQETISQNLKNKFPNSLLVEVTRTFKSPIELVWEAWSQPELVKQWWGPAQFTCPAAKIDFKVGGKFHFAMQDPEGMLTWSTGTLEEIIPLERLVWTDSFSDENGKIISANETGLAGNWPLECLVTIDFQAADPEFTTIRIRHEGIPVEMHDDCVSGWSSSLDKMQTLVEKNYPI